MDNEKAIGASLKLLGKTKQGLRRFEENLDVPTDPLDPDGLFLQQQHVCR